MPRTAKSKKSARERYVPEQPNVNIVICLTLLSLLDLIRIVGCPGIARFSKEFVRAMVFLRAGTTSTIRDVACDVFEDCNGHVYECVQRCE